VKKRIISLLLAAASAATLITGCTTKKTISNETTDQTGGKLFKDPVTFKMMVQSNPSFPYQKDWYIEKAISEKTNVNFEVIPVSTNYAEKINITMASGDIPDLMYTTGLDVAHRYGAQGAFVNVLDSISKLPSFKKWRENNKDFVSNYLSADGKLYLFPEQGIAETNRRGWLYREDIFKKHNLSMPKDEKELYDVLKKLKELYPKSYPFTFREGLDQFAMMAASWGTDSGMYYDQGKKEWRFGPVENNYKEMIAFYNKLYNDGLIPPDFLSINTKVWQDAFSTNSAFVTVDYLSRIDFFNGSLRKDNPQFTIAYMTPIKGGANGVAKMASSATNIAGFNVAANSKQLEQLLKYCDWLYTDEAKQLMSWGEEGKTYKVENGSKKFINSTDVTSVRKNYGLSTNGFYLLTDFSSHMSTFTEELNKGITESRKYDLPARPTVAFDDKEREVLQTVGVSIDKYMKQEISKFILGNRPVSDWDKYVQEVEKLGLKQLVDVYKNAYERQLKNSK
jgi:putative aldouronate transport system substrate-binding protein